MLNLMSYMRHRIGLLPGNLRSGNGWMSGSTSPFHEPWFTDPLEVKSADAPKIIPAGELISDVRLAPIPLGNGIAVGG